MTMKRDLVYERFYKHPPERVWKALTDPTWLAAWYMANDFQPVVGHKFTFRTAPVPEARFDGVLYCEVTLVDAPHKLIYTFIGGYMERKTTVTWTLTPQDGGTLLRLEHTGFTGLTDVAVSSILDSGWQQFLLGIDAVLEKIACQE
jgi:uncharacterized protein YndB with AHSA1/START domain